MLQPQVRLGISTPKADPAGDYAWALFQKAEALQLAPLRAWRPRRFNSQVVPIRRKLRPVATLMRGMEQNRADVFLTHCTNAVAARAEVPSPQVVAVPEALQVGAALWFTVALARLPRHRRLPRRCCAPGAGRVPSVGFAAPLRRAGYFPVSFKRCAFLWAQRFYWRSIWWLVNRRPPVAAAPDGTHQPKTAHHPPRNPEKAERWQAKQRGPACTKS